MFAHRVSHVFDIRACNSTFIRAQIENVFFFLHWGENENILVSTIHYTSLLCQVDTLTHWNRVPFVSSNDMR